MATARTARALLAASALSLATLGSAVVAAERPDADAPGSAARVPYALVEDRDVADRLATPEDRYAVAGGCYTLEAPGAGFVGRSGSGLRLVAAQDDAEPLHFQATRLGEYLLAAREGRDTRYEGAWWDVRSYLAAPSALAPVAAAAPLPGGAKGTLTTAGEAVASGSAVALAPAPSTDAEWRLLPADGDDPDRRLADQQYVLELGDRGRLTATGGTVALGEGTPLRLRHVPDDDLEDDDPNGTRCATWPEIETGADREPAPQPGGPAAPVRGFFEAHVHGMAFEFLGGELRCGRPWHPYGVEFALGSCAEEGNPLNGVLEVPLGGNPAQYLAGYDPVGWPTFRSWPQNRTLTHEQFYWRWLERAHAGGLRLLTNLLVDNTALCQAFPVKKNSCNEMDSVRLQAERVFELQDYVDAQNGGPGEGWFRVVSTPTQAREVIRDGRLAVVLGVEVSNLFDCVEVLDQPQCTAEQIDQRLQEVYDMGVRQMELVNKFDNALSGVTGDAGTTGPVVNTGNKHVTGHYWDMRRCVPDEADDHGHAHGHDRDGDAHEADAHEADAHEADAHEADAHEADAHEADAHEADANEADAHGGAQGGAAHESSSAAAARGKYQGSQADKTQISPTDATPEQAEGVDALAGRVLDQFGGVSSVAAPVYGPGPHCNTRGLTELGEHLVRAMVAKGMFFDPDHMSGAGQRAALDLIQHEIVPAERAAAAAEGRAPVQPSVISSHSWGNDVTYQRLYDLRGTVAPYAGEPRTYASDWLQRKRWAAEQGMDEAEFGMGYGADTNGLGGQPGPRRDPGRSLQYTEEGFAAPVGGVRLTQHRSGLRTFDVTKEGVAHYGLFADWFQEVQLAAEDVAGRDAGGKILDDMLNAPEQYISMWERAVFGARDCVADQSAVQLEDLHAALGANVEGLLDAIGQPADRSDDAFVYCAQEDGAVAAYDVVLDESGRASAVRPTTSDVRPVSTVDAAVEGTVDGHAHVHLPAGPALPGGAGAALGLLTLVGGAARHLLRHGPR